VRERELNNLLRFLPGYEVLPPPEGRAALVPWPYASGLLSCAVRDYGRAPPLLLALSNVTLAINVSLRSSTAGIAAAHGWRQVGAGEALEMPHLPQ